MKVLPRPGGIWSATCWNPFVNKPVGTLAAAAHRVPVMHAADQDGYRQATAMYCCGETDGGRQSPPWPGMVGRGRGIRSARHSGCLRRYALVELAWKL